MHKLLLLVSAFSLLTSFAHGQQPPSALPPSPPPFRGEAEAGAILVSGASSSESYAGKLSMAYTQDKNIYSGAGAYIRSEANGIESARNWNLGVRYDRELSDYFSVFVGQKVESDVYSGYTQRDSTDLGVKYYLIKSDSLNWTVEVGDRYSKTQPLPGTPQYANYGRLYSEVNKSWDKNLSVKYWAEYLPNFTDGHAYLFNTEASLNIMLNSIFSLKLAYLLQYQNAPAGNADYSTNTTTMNLVAKF
ncbi:MAG TPA: DUF481 domain-containing protein [Bdellovibrio sp.]|uniref:DUF481 domain-containing protein n=1 Tax=Bdellovibrio sp. TaxID=28201 RepID=UPI002EE14A9D